jgi:hypothetical protein
MPLELFSSFAFRLTREIGLGESHAVRSKMLLDAYRIKWVCIMLNEFLPQEEARRDFALSDRGRAERREKQLAKAASRLAELKPTGL